MIDLYTWGTPNGRKISIMLEEARLDYVVHPVDIENAHDQFNSAFTELNPNHKIPVIVDHDAPGGPLTVFESGAILLHLAERTGQYLSADPHKRSQAIQWLFWQMSGLGPFLGQYGHFRARKEPDAAYGKERYLKEAVRLFDVLERQLDARDFVAGEYSIADMAIYPWIVYGRWRLAKDTDYHRPNIDRWQAAMAQRPAVGRGMAVLTPQPYP